MTNVSVTDGFNLEPGPESKEDKAMDAAVTPPNKRTFQFNVPWGGGLVRLGDGGLPRCELRRSVRLGSN